MLRTTLLILLLNLASKCCIAQIAFAPQVLFNPEEGSNLHVTGDFDNDGFRDLVMASGSNFNTNFYLWMFKQQGGQLVLVDSLEYTASHYWRCYSMAAGDLNNDGRNDIVMAFSDTVRIYFQDMVTGFFNETNSQMFIPDSGQEVHGLECGDLNGDGLMDFAATHLLNENLNVYYQDSNQGFTKSVYYKKLAGRNSIIATDMNNDGWQDLIVSNGTVFSSMSNGNWYSFAIYLQDSISHLLQYPLFYAMDTITPNYWNSNYCGGIAVGDLDQDGLKDVVVSREEEIYIWHHVTGNPVFLMNPVDTLDAYLGSEPVLIADLNNDNKNEIVMTHGGHSYISIYESDPAFVFSNYALLFQWTCTQMDIDQFSVIDMNNDGWNDLITSHGFGFAIRYNTQGVGWEEVESAVLSMDAYPNPVTDNYLRLKFQIPLTSIGYIELRDITGNIKLKDELTGLDSEQQIDVSSLESGIYFVVFHSSEISMTKKIVVFRNSQ